MVIRKPMLIILFCLFLSACVTTAPIRTVDNNTFISDYPKIKIQVSQEFEYNGTYERKYKTPAVDRTRDPIETIQNTYRFVIKDEDFKIVRIFMIRLSRVSTRYGDTGGTKKDYDLEFEKVKINGETFNKSTNMTTFKKEYLPMYGLYTSVSRVIDTNRRYELYLNYCEDLTKSGYPVHAWQDPRILTREQRKIIEEFNKRFMAAFKVLDL